MGENKEKGIKPKKTEQKKCLDILYDEGYRKILSLVTPCIAFGTGVAWLIQMIQDPDIYWYMEIGRWIGKLVGNIVVGCIIIAVGLLILEKLNMPIRWIPESNKGVDGQSRRTFRRSQIVVEAFFELFFILVFLLAPQIFCGVFQGGAEVITVFNIPFIQATWGTVAILWALGFIQSVCKGIYATYNGIVLAVTWITNGMSALIAVGWLRSGELINPLFIQKVISVMGTQERLVVSLITNVQELVLVVICFGLVIESIEVFLKTFLPVKS